MSDAPKKVSTKIWRPILEKLEKRWMHPVCVGMRI
jgi:hypothetical protein